MPSNCYDTSMILIWKTDNAGNPEKKPALIRANSKHMGGIDHVDQQLHAIHVLRKHYKWYKKLAFRLLSQCMLNAYKLFQKNVDPKATFLGYLHDVIIQLVSRKLCNPNDRLQMDDSVSRLSGRHFPSLKVAQPGSKDKRPAKACRVCSAKGKRTNKGEYVKKTYVCTYCPSEPGLHPDKCFELYHTMQDFSN